MHYLNGDPSTQKILLKPILDHIYYLGKKITECEVSYYSVEDDCDGFAGIYGLSITESTTVGVEDLVKGQNQPMLVLTLKSPQEATPLLPDKKQRLQAKNANQISKNLGGEGSVEK